MDTDEGKAAGNWDAGAELVKASKGSVNRKIWTAIDTDQYGSAGYTGSGGWNYWNSNI